MAIAQRDYILRMIQQFAEAMARIVSARKQGDFDEALEAIKQTAAAIFGPLYRMLEGVDAASAVMLLAEPEKARIYAALTAEEATILEARGDLGRAAVRYRRALELYLELLDASPEERAPLVVAIEELRPKVDAQRLAEKYRDKLGL